MKIIITGATGLAGSEALRQLLLHPSVSQVTVLTRRELPPHIQPTPQNAKLRVIIHTDFNSYPSALLQQLEGYDGAIWDLGKTSIGMKEPEYEVIHVDYPLSAAKAFAAIKPEVGQKFVFTYLSGEGTTQDGAKATSMFGEIKGRAEAQLATLSASHPTLSTFSFRPAMILPVTPSPDDMFVKKMIFSIVRFIRPLINKYTIDANVLAQGMMEAIFRGGSGVIPGWEEKGKEGDFGAFGNLEIAKLASERESEK
ncbi:hypothetical protein P7C70_g518, partial [Phenoliferia sp. Uapishka_3]